MSKISISILTISTSCYYKGKSDVSGDLIESIARKEGWVILDRKLVPDNKRMIVKILKYFADRLKPNLIITTGGTGLGPYDLTPEATLKVCERIVPGIPELLRVKNLKKTIYASLSRGIAGIRKNSLIINLPGSPSAVKESLDLLKKMVNHIVDIMAGKGHKNKI